MNQLRQQARELKEKKNFKKAIDLYTQIWPNHSDIWVGWEYAVCLKHQGKLDEAINVLKEVLSRNNKFYYAKNLLSWCLYERYFKTTKKKYNFSEITHLIKVTEEIINLVDQTDKSPYEYTIFKLIKILKANAAFPAAKLLYWLDKIDIELVQDIPFKFEFKGRKGESQSNKEMYYAYKTRALYEQKEYEECISCCEEALVQIERFHHDNDIWIEVRKAKSIGMLGDIDIAINKLIDLAAIKKHWSLYMNIAEFYYKKCNKGKALLYYYRAALTKDPCRMKVELYYKIGLMLEEQGDNYTALLHYLFVKQIRIRNEWSISSKLIRAIGRVHQMQDSIKKDIDINNLKIFWLNEVRRMLGTQSGIVIKMIAQGKAGFVRANNKNYFFEKSAIVNNIKIKQGDKISFCLVDSYDKKKRVGTIAAGYIEKID
mgnify:CR=1 FL=1